MKHLPHNSKQHLITVEIPSEIYAALLEKAKITNKTESELVIQGLQQVLQEQYLDEQEQERFATLEKTLEQKLKQYVETLIQDRVSASELIDHSPQTNFDLDISPAKLMPIPTIRPLQIGDRVLVLEPESPYYMAKLVVIKTSLIRATVETDMGEKTFLKRDLRFIETVTVQNT